MGATSADATMRAQVEYWKTHTATTPQEADAKVAAYRYANDNGIKGASWLNSSEVKLQGGSTGVDWDNLGTGLGVLGAGAAGLVTGGVGAAAVGGALAAAGPSVQAATNPGTGTFGQGGAPAASYLTPVGASGGGGAPNQSTWSGLAQAATPQASGNRSVPTMPAGYSAAQPAVAKGDPSNGAWDAFVPAGGIPATGGSMATPNYAPQTGTTGNPYLDAILAQTAGPGGVVPANTSIIQNQVAPAIAQQKDTSFQTNVGIQQTLAPENQLIGGYGAFNAGLAAQGSQAASGANTANLGYLSDYQKTLGGMSQLAPTPYQGDWVSNPSDVAQQQASYNQLAGIGGGSLDYTAAQAGMQTASMQQAELAQAALQLAKYKEAHSNPGDVQHEQDALSQLTSNAGGALDVHAGQEDPAAWSAAHSALDQFGALTNPQRTAQEEFLYEQQRAREEQDQRTSRAAVMENLRARGMSGSGMELTDQLGSDQITSQNRLLGDLGTQATAVARSQSALQNYGQLGTALSAQGNAIAQGNQGVRESAAVAQGGLASDIRGQGLSENQFNSNAYNQNEEFNANAFNQNSITNAQLRESNNEFNANAYNQNQQFNAGAYNDNQIANATFKNNASSSNQQTRLSGSLGAATTASNMRTASDAVGMANQQQQGISNRANDIFRSDQQLQATNRATDVFNAGQGTTQTNLGNTERSLGASSQLADKTLGAGLTGLNDTRDYWKTVQATGQQNTQNTLAFGGLATGTNIAGASTATDALSKAAGNFAAGQASGSLGSNIYNSPTTYTPYVTPYASPYYQPGKTS